MENLGIWIGCAIGQTFHIALRVQAMLRSGKNECDTLREVAQVYGLEITVKAAVVFSVQGIWLASAESFNAAMGALGVPVPPLISWTAFAWGLMGSVLMDALAEKYPYLRRALKGNGNGNGNA